MEESTKVCRERKVAKMIKRHLREAILGVKFDAGERYRKQEEVDCA